MHIVFLYQSGCCGGVFGWSRADANICGAGCGHVPLLSGPCDLIDHAKRYSISCHSVRRLRNVASEPRFI